MGYLQKNIKFPALAINGAMKKNAMIVSILDTTFQINNNIIKISDLYKNNNVGLSFFKPFIFIGACIFYNSKKICIQVKKKTNKCYFIFNLKSPTCISVYGFR